MVVGIQSEIGLVVWLSGHSEQLDHGEEGEIMPSSTGLRVTGISIVVVFPLWIMCAVSVGASRQE